MIGVEVVLQFAELENVFMLKYIVGLFMVDVFVYDGGGGAAMIEAWHVCRPGLHPPLSTSTPHWCHVEEGQSEAWDLKVLGEAEVPADLAPWNLLK